MEPSTVAIIIFGLAFVSFMLEKIPLALTCIVGSLAMVFTGILDYGDLYSGFGNKTVIMVVGMMVVGAALDETGVTALIGRALSRCGLHKNERIFIFVVFLAAAGMSGFFSNNGTISLFIPIIQAMSKVPQSKITQRNALMPIGMAAGIGGGLTLVGTPPQLIASNILVESGVEGTRAITFWETGYSMLPIVLVAAVYFLTIGYNIEKKALKDRPLAPLDELTTQLGESEEQSENSVPKWKTYFSIAVLGGIVLAFMFDLWDVAIIAITGATLLILTGCIRWKKSLTSIDWNTIVILGSSVALAAGLNKSGGGMVIANAAVQLFGGEDVNKYVMLIVLICVSVFLTNFMGNMALVAALVPISLDIALLVGANPMGYAVTVTVACLLAISTPIGTAAVTQTLIGGYKFKDYVKLGLPINIIMTILLCIIAPIVYTI